MSHNLALLGNARAVIGLVTDRLDTFVKLTRQAADQSVTVRLPTKRVHVLADPTDIRTVLLDRNRRYTKGMGQAESRNWVGHGVLTAEGSPWREQRQDIGTQLAARHVHQKLDGISNLATCHAEQLAGAAPAHLDAMTLTSQYTLDVLSLVLECGHFDARTIHECFSILQDRAMTDTVTMGMVPNWATPRGTARCNQARTTLLRAAETALRTRPAPEPGDEPKSWATPDRLLTLMLAGYETTASTLAWTVARLARNPRLQDEMAQHAQSARDANPIESPAYARFKDLFHEVVQERPPVWLISRRAKVPDTIGSRTITPGDDVVVCPQGLHADSTSRAGEADWRFGAGPRACPGGALAEIEAVLWMTHILSRVRFELVPGIRARPNARMSQSLEGFTVRVTPRAPR